LEHCNCRRNLWLTPRLPFSVLYVVDPSDRDTWKDLAEMRQELGGGDWHSSKVFEEVGCALSHHLTPGQFWTLPENDRAYMVAFERTRSTMEAYAHHVAEKAAKRKRR
jgi:hypothetical protein